jgi:hypothetical protein
MHLSNIRSQYASVGTKAKPTHDTARMRRQSKNKGRLPLRSDRVPQTMGAVHIHQLGFIMGGIAARTNALQNHVHRHREVDELNGLPELN